MKKIYQTPTSEIIYLAASDIITASALDAEQDNFGTDIIEIG